MAKTEKKNLDIPPWTSFRAGIHYYGLLFLNISLKLMCLFVWRRVGDFGGFANHQTLFESAEYCEA